MNIQTRIRNNVKPPLAVPLLSLIQNHVVGNTTTTTTNNNDDDNNDNTNDNNHQSIGVPG